MITIPRAALFLAALSATVHAHLAPWTKGMYCKNGLSNTDQQAVDYPITPLWNMSQNDWFLHGPCRQYPPPDGEYLKIPANGNFTVEIAANRVFTTLSYNGLKTTDWPDGQNHTEPYTATSDPNFPPSSAGCIGSPNIHAKAQGDAAGTAFAISYNGNINTVKPTDFTVFSILPNSPWKRLATYQVPSLPACPSGGCLCAWAWIPNHCGQDNMYQIAFRCQVTGADPNAPAVGTPKPAVWCESDPDRCLAGPKQMTIAFQAEGNNFVNPGGLQKDNTFPSPGYNLKMGFKPGALPRFVFHLQALTVSYRQARRRTSSSRLAVARRRRRRSCQGLPARARSS
ncbi:hypothetical protein AURDEDRAFT_69982 [Auricularia subglabra TFB-10046 SS5]|nr:hypothetical protein AURDEDRAFT_69982 [Auricularia subglabra TFB-10046 SS5]